MSARLDQSGLFLMRLWGEDSGDPSGAEDSGVDALTAIDTNSAIRPRWHGKLLHVVTGEALYFFGWQDLVAILQSKFPESTEAKDPPTVAH